MKTKVLWIEDGALGDLDELLGPVNIEGDYDLQIAEDATQAIGDIMREEYKAVIVDIRLQPGDDPQWVKIYNSIETNPNAARLGLLILRSLLPSKTGRPSEVKLRAVPDWVRPEVFGVLTIENVRDLREDLDDLRIDEGMYRQKSINPSDTILLELIKKVMARGHGE